MGLFSKLFGDTKSEPQATEHKGFQIYPEPMKDGGEYRLAARVELGEGDAIRSHHLIRADTFTTPDAASDAAVAKAKQLIDQMGERLFD